MNAARRFQFGRTIIDYTLQRGRRRTVAIRVDPRGAVEVAVPNDFDEDRLCPLLKAKAPWIVQKRLLVAEQAPPAQPQLISGERLPYLGRRYQLLVRRQPGAEPGLSFDGARWRAVVPSGCSDDQAAAMLRPKLVAWYRERALEQLQRRVARYAAILGVEWKRLRIRDQVRRWGSCSKSGDLAFNWRIVMAPASAVDYVVAHELVHLRHRDHGVRFWRTLGSVMPDYEARREWLRRHGAELTA